MEYLVVKWLHILSSALLFGTGIGSAFYLFVTVLGSDMRLVAHVARWVVRADWLFTATTVIAQPLTGLWLLRLKQVPLQTGWVAWSLALYLLAIAAWLPVVWLQIRLRDLAQQAADQGRGPTPQFRRLFLAWLALGAVALFAFLAIFWLMVAGPLR